MLEVLRMRNISECPDLFQSSWRRLNRTWQSALRRHDNPVSVELERTFWDALTREYKATQDVMFTTAKLMADVRRHVW